MEGGVTLNLTLNGKVTSLTSSKGRSFVTDCAKAASSQLAPRDLLVKYGLTAEALQNYTRQEAFVRALRAEHDRRNDIAARKAATNKKQMDPVPDLAQTLMKDQSFIEDLCRFSEGIFTEAAVRKRWRLSESDWVRLGSDDELVRAIEEEKLRRIRSGATKREIAQKHIIRMLAGLRGVDGKGSDRHPKLRVSAGA